MNDATPTYAPSGLGHLAPILGRKAYHEASVFQVENLLREGRRQRRRTDERVPAVCILDPDGDVVRHLRTANNARLHDGWACYHSELWVTSVDGTEIGVVPCAVGAPYAVLIAEQLAASGCALIISITSAGRVIALGEPPYFMIIERARRDEGTSLHYLPPSEWAHLDPALLTQLRNGLDNLDEPVFFGSSWTTDAPFRETPTAIADAERAGVHAVEMEASALYAFAAARNAAVVCVAHVTNTLAVDGDDFEKGEADGTHRILQLATAIARRLQLTPARQRGRSVVEVDGWPVIEPIQGIATTDADVQVWRDGDQR